MASQVYLDTNVFIAAYEGVGDISDAAWHIMDAIEGGHVEALTSELTLAELLSKLPSDHEALASVYQETMQSRPGLTIQPVNRAVLIEAARVRRHTPSIKLPDAIHLASADLSSCTHFLSGDKRLSTRSNMRFVSLRLGVLDDISG